MYNYQTERPKILTDEGQRDFLKVRDRAKELLISAGAFKTFNPSAKMTGDVWYLTALVDRMVELGEIQEITNNSVAGQDRVFVSASGK